MQTIALKKPLSTFACFSIITAVIAAIDQLIKYKIRHSGGFYVCNKGISFGINLSPFILWLTLAILLIVIIAISLKISKKEPLFSFFPLGIALLGGGALSNLIDRLLFGCVLDYLFLFRTYLPVFNIADVCISVGGCLIICAVLKKNNLFC